MGFIYYLMLGTVVFGAGTGIRHYIYHETSPSKLRIYQLTAACFVIMLGVAWALNAWVLQKATPDFAFIIVTALVGAFVFYQAINPDKNQNVPD